MLRLSDSLLLRQLELSQTVTRMACYSAVILAWMIKQCFNWCIFKVIRFFITYACLCELYLSQMLCYIYTCEVISTTTYTPSIYVAMQFSLLSVVLYLCVCIGITIWWMRLIFEISYTEMIYQARQGCIKDNQEKTGT